MNENLQVIFGWIFVVIGFLLLIYIALSLFGFAKLIIGG